VCGAKGEKRLIYVTATGSPRPAGPVCIAIKTLRVGTYYKGRLRVLYARGGGRPAPLVSSGKTRRKTLYPRNTQSPTVFRSLLPSTGSRHPIAFDAGGVHDIYIYNDDVGDCASGGGREETATKRGSCRRAPRARNRRAITRNRFTPPEMTPL